MAQQGILPEEKYRFKKYYRIEEKVINFPITSTKNRINFRKSYTKKRSHSSDKKKNKYLIDFHDNQKNLQQNPNILAKNDYKNKFKENINSNYSNYYQYFRCNTFEESNIKNKSLVNINKINIFSSD